LSKPVEVNNAPLMLPWIVLPANVAVPDGRLLDPLKRFTVAVPSSRKITTESNSTPGASAPKRAAPLPRSTPQT